jgi:hypothetical protein
MGSDPAFDVADMREGAVPSHLQFRRNQPVFGIGGVILPESPVGGVAGSFQIAAEGVPDLVAATGCLRLGLGGGGNDGLYGGSETDLLIGGDGDDLINGGTEADTMAGDAGNDKFIVDNLSDVVVESIGKGTADRVYASVSYQLASGEEIEILNTSSNGGVGAINLVSNGFVQTIVGNAGANILNGLGGADTMQGLGGDDKYHIDNANDVVVEAVAGGTDRVYTSASYSLDGDHGPASMERASMATRSWPVWSAAGAAAASARCDTREPSAIAAAAGPRAGSRSPRPGLRRPQPRPGRCQLLRRAGFQPI